VQEYFLYSAGPANKGTWDQLFAGIQAIIPLFSIVIAGLAVFYSAKTAKRQAADNLSAKRQIWIEDLPPGGLKAQIFPFVRLSRSPLLDSNVMMTLKNTSTIAIMSFLVGVLFCTGGFFVLFKLRDSVSVTEIRFLIGVCLLVFGVYFFQVSNTQHLCRRIEALEKRLQKSEPNP
jgi:hypothetical protein